MPRCCCRAVRSTGPSRPRPRSGWPQTTELRDELSGGTDRPPRTRLRLLAAGLCALLALLYVVDRAERTSELDLLLRKVTDAQATATYADGRIGATIAYTSPQLVRASTPAHLRRSLEVLVEQTAADQVPSLAAARKSVAEVRVLPWHRSLRRARAAAGRYLDLRLGRLRAGGRDIDVLFTSDPGAADAERAARDALLAAGAQPGEVRRALGPP